MDTSFGHGHRQRIVDACCRGKGTNPTRKRGRVTLWRAWWPNLTTRRKEFVRCAGHRDDLAYASGWCCEHPVPQGGRFFQAKSENRLRNLVVVQHDIFRDCEVADPCASDSAIRKDVGVVESPPKAVQRSSRGIWWATSFID